jgi:membrane-associated phospholipid phosphatase
MAVSSTMMLLAYLAITSVIAVARLPAQPAIRWVLLSNALIGLLVWVLNRYPLGSIGRVIREIYPILLLGALYPAIDILNNFGRVAVHDDRVRGWELALFGGEPSRTWWQSSHSVFWSTIFHGTYFAFYPIVLAPPIVFLVLARLEDARRAVRWILATFLTCYLVFLLFPVAGPYYEFPRPDAWFIANPMARLVYATLEKGSAYGAAFPSSHVAATLVATAAAFTGSRKLGWILLIPALLLSIGVVYCQMHYAVDALAGIGVAAGVVAVGWWNRRSSFGPPRSA